MQSRDFSEVEKNQLLSQSDWLDTNSTKKTLAVLRHEQQIVSEVLNAFIETREKWDLEEDEY